MKIPSTNWDKIVTENLSQLDLELDSDNPEKLVDNKKDSIVNSSNNFTQLTEPPDSHDLPSQREQPES